MIRIYAHLITSRTKMLDSWGCDLVLALWHLVCHLLYKNNRKAFVAFTGKLTKMKTAQERGARVYIQDDIYSWLPGELVDTITEDSKTASVAVTLPADWRRHTYAPDHKSLRQGTLERGAGGRYLRNVCLADYDEGRLPLQNVDEGTGEIAGKSDIADLPHLHEAAVLYNLKDRHSRAVPYTRVGDIIVAMNPYQVREMARAA